MDKIGLAIVGATGIVGQEILGLLSEESQSLGPIQLIASDDSIGEYYSFLGKEIQVRSLDSLDFSEPTLTVLCAPRDISENIFPDLLAKSVALIDCSGLDRAQHNLVPLPASLLKHSKPQAYFMRSAAGFMLEKFFTATGLAEKIQNISVTCLEPVSGAGRLGLDELWNQVRAVFNQSVCEPEFFPEQIAFNLLSHVDLLRDDGSTAFEARVAAELSQVLTAPELSLSVTGLRVPIMYGAAVSFSFTTKEDLSLEDLLSRLKMFKGIELVDNQDPPPSTLASLGNDKMLVARIRRPFAKTGAASSITGFIVADNIRACIARPIVDAYCSLLPMS